MPLLPVCREVCPLLCPSFTRFTVGRTFPCSLVPFFLHIYQLLREKEALMRPFYPFHCWARVLSSARKCQNGHFCSKLSLSSIPACFASRVGPPPWYGFVSQEALPPPLFCIPGGSSHPIVLYPRRVQKVGERPVLASQGGPEGRERPVLASQGGPGERERPILASQSGPEEGRKACSSLPGWVQRREKGLF